MVPAFNSRFASVSTFALVYAMTQHAKNLMMCIQNDEHTFADCRSGPLMMAVPDCTSGQAMGSREQRQKNMHHRPHDQDDCHASQHPESLGCDRPARYQQML